MNHKGKNHSRQPKHGRYRLGSCRLDPLVIDNPVNRAAYWSQDIYHLKDLVKQHPLPQVVRCANRLVPGEEDALPVNVHVPMLLCNGRSALKLLAKHIVSDVKSGKLSETEDSIAIPCDFEGNFLRLSCRTTKDTTVVQSLASIAKSDCLAFVSFSQLTSFANYGPEAGMTTRYPSMSSISNAQSGHRINTPEGSVASFTKGNKAKILDTTTQMRLLHAPGSVFLIKQVFKGQVRDKKKKKSRDVTFLYCSDEKGQEFSLPADQAGECVEVEKPPTSQQKLSVQSRDLISSKRYPAVVRYVYGPHPPRLTPCSKMFTLIDTFEEDSLIGCLLYPGHALMIEMPLATSLTFQVAINSEDVLQMPLPRHAMNIVRERRDVFVKDLKLKCKFLHEVNKGVTMATSTRSQLDEEMLSVTVRSPQYASEAFFYL